MSWTNLKAGIANVIKFNGNQEITGNALQGVLNTIVNSLGAYASFAGIATPSTSPGTPDGPVFYIAAQPGVYSNFGNTPFTVSDYALGVFSWDGTVWSFTGISVGDIASALSRIVDSFNTQFEQLKLEIDGTIEQTLTIVRGSISSSTGENTTASNRLRTSNYIEHSNIRVEITNGYYIVYGYNDDGYVGAATSDWTSTSGNYSLQGCTKFRIVFRFLDNASITTSDFPSLGVKVYAIDLSEKKMVLISDIVNDLTTGGTGNPLSAEQGKVLKTEIDTATSDVTNLKNAFLDGKLVIKTETPDYTVGYHYNTSGAIIANSDSVYIAPIDISEYAGKGYSIRFSLVVYQTVGARYQLITDENGVVLELYTHTSMTVDGDRTYRLFEDIPANAKWLKLSWSRKTGVQYAPKIEYIASLDSSSSKKDLTIYVNPADGDDINNFGTETSPYKTLGKALSESTKKNIVLEDGIYDESGLSLTNGVNIVARNVGKAIFLPSANIVTDEDGTLVSGSTKVYQLPLDSSMASAVNSCVFIYQYGVDDALTEIDNAFRLPVHKDYQHRCDFSAIKHVGSLELVESSEYFAFYVDTANNVLYYSRPSGVSSSKPLFKPSTTALFSNPSDKTFSIKGLRMYSVALSLNGSKNVEITDCSVFACGGNGCILFNKVFNLRLLRCEAARAEFDYSHTTGDGFNTHGQSLVPSIFTLEDCWAHDNYNDGYSDHENSIGTIIRGVYEYNCVQGHGAGLTPAYGAKDTIDGAICQKNNFDGIQYTAAPSALYTEYGSLTIMNVLSRNNARHGVRVSADNSGKVFATAINVLSYNNASAGFSNSGESLVCINCKAVGNSTDFSGCTNT